MNLTQRREGRKDAVIALLFPIFTPSFPLSAPLSPLSTLLFSRSTPVIPAKAGIQKAKASDNGGAATIIPFDSNRQRARAANRSA